MEMVKMVRSDRSSKLAGFPLLGITLVALDRGWQAMVHLVAVLPLKRSSPRLCSGLPATFSNVLFFLLSFWSVSDLPISKKHLVARSPRQPNNT